MGYHYNFSYDLPAADASAAFGSFGVAFFLLTYLLPFALSIVTYVFQSIGMYTIANRRGIRHPWLAWLPIGNMWILGSIADQYQYVAKGNVRNRRKVLTGLDIAMIALLIVWSIVFFGMFINIIINAPQLETMPDAEVLSLFLSPLLSVLGLTLVMWVVAVIAMVFQYICLHNLYASCDPENRTVYTVLSILFAVVMPFLIFACRKKDLGMPPRREPAPLPPVEEPTE